MEKSDIEMTPSLSEDVFDRISHFLGSLDDLKLSLDKDISIEENFTILSQGSKSPSLRNLISTIIFKISNLINNESPAVNIDSKNEVLWKELTISFLRSHSGIHSPYTWMAYQFDNFEGTMTILEYLVSELQASIMISSNELPFKMETEPIHTKNSIFNEEIRKCCSIVGASIQEDNTKSLANIEMKVKEHLPKLPKEYLGGLILNSTQYNPNEVKKLEEINTILNEEYTSRKKLMIKRVDVTLESFLWSSKGEANKKDINAAIEKKRKELNSDCNISLYDAFVAHQERASITKTSAASIIKDTRSSFTSMIIGDVPDRGGRVERRSELPKAKLAPQAPREQRNFAKNGNQNRRDFHKQKSEVEKTSDNVVISPDSNENKKRARVQGELQSNEGSENSKRGRGGGFQK